MKNAKELNAIAKAECERIINEKVEKTTKYLDTKIVPAMEKAAAEGAFKVSLYLDAWVDFDVIVKALEENGFSVSKSGTNLKIYWV
jgi:hypothetical protein